MRHRKEISAMTARAKAAAALAEIRAILNRCRRRAIEHDKAFYAYPPEPTVPVLFYVMLHKEERRIAKLAGYERRVNRLSKPNTRSGKARKRAKR